MGQEAYLLPSCNLFVRPDARGVETVARSFVGDEGRLTDDEGAWNARTCSIMLDSKIGVSVLVVCSVAGKGCHDDSVLEGGVAELDRLEEFRSGHWKVRLLLNECCLLLRFLQNVLFYRAASPQSDFLDGCPCP